MDFGTPARTVCVRGVLASGQRGFVLAPAFAGRVGFGGLYAEAARRRDGMGKPRAAAMRHALV